MAVTPEPALEAPPRPEKTDAEGYPRWPLWLPLGALAIGVPFGIVAIAMLAGVLDATGIETDGDAPGINNAATVILDLAVVGASVMLAAATLRPRASHFGLRGGPLRLAATVALAGFVVFLLFELVYSQVVKPDNPQKVIEDLGAETNTALLLVAAAVVIVVAPICEEIFFRGVLFRVLRMRLPLWVAAVADGLAFGLVHGSLVILPILGFLGIVLCYVFERTGTLFATIAIHAVNNTISYGVTADAWGAALPLGAAMLAFCAIGLVRASRGVPPGAANPGRRLDLPHPG